MQFTFNRFDNIICVVSQPERARAACTCCICEDTYVCIYALDLILLLYFESDPPRKEYISVLCIVDCDNKNTRVHTSNRNSFYHLLYDFEKVNLSVPLEQTLYYWWPCAIRLYLESIYDLIFGYRLKQLHGAAREGKLPRLIFDRSEVSPFIQHILFISTDACRFRIWHLNISYHNPINDSGGWLELCSTFIDLLWLPARHFMAHIHVNLYE